MNKDWANLTKYLSKNRKLMNRTNSVVFMGDSITEFWKVIHGSFFTSKSYINRGISGQTTPQMLLRFQQDVIDLKPSIVVILAGINDIAENTGPRTTEEIMDTIILMVEMANANKIKVILCTILPSNHFYWNPKLEPANKVIALNKLILDYSQKNKISLIDYYSAMVDGENGLQKKYGPDGVHPNLEGYKVMENLISVKLNSTEFL